MKTKEEILKMSYEELRNYKACLRSGCYDCSKCDDCQDCSKCDDCPNCSKCDDCQDFSKCFLCVKLKSASYQICNIQLTKKEYENKMQELKAANLTNPL